MRSLSLVPRLLAALLFASPLPAAQMAGVQGDLDFDFGRWPYPLHREVSHRLDQLAEQHPNLARTHIIGKSRKGRDLQVIEITNFDTGPGETKPALWLDGNIHANEVTGRQMLWYFAEAVLHGYGKDPVVTRLVDTRTFYVMPIFDARRRGERPDPTSRLARPSAGGTRRPRPRRRRLHHPDARPGSGRRVVSEPAGRAVAAAGAGPHRRPLELRAHHPRRTGRLRGRPGPARPALPCPYGRRQPRARGDRRARRSELQPELVGRMAAGRARRRPVPLLAAGSAGGGRVHHRTPQHLLHLHDPLGRRRPELHRATADEPSLRIHASRGQRLLYPLRRRPGRRSRGAA